MLICAALSAFGPPAKTAAAEHAPETSAQAGVEQEHAGAWGFDRRSAAEIGGLHNLPQPDGQRDHAHDRNRAPGLHRLSWRKCPEIALPAGVAQGIAAIPGSDQAGASADRRFAENAKTSANPVRAYTNWLKEDADYIKFVNPGDLRVAEQTCGRSGCHTPKSSAYAPA